MKKKILQKIAMNWGNGATLAIFVKQEDMTYPILKNIYF